MKIFQNLKSGFANIKELFTTLLGDETSNIENNYDVYINSQDAAIAKTAQELKTIEEEQEQKRLSIFTLNKRSTKKKTSKEDDIKDDKHEASNKND